MKMEGNTIDFTVDFTTHNETENPEFAEELRRISAMDASVGLTNEESMCGPIFSLPNLFTHEIKIDTRFNQHIQKITEIRNHLTNNANHTNNINNLSEDDSDQTFDDKYKGMSVSILEFLKEMDDCRKKLTELEDKIEKANKENSKDIELIQTFMNFLVNVKNSTSDTDEIISDQFTDEMVVVCDKIKEKNSLKDVRKEYDAQQKEYTRFLKVLLLVNNMNTGNLCSICISQTVTSYYNPCGHTTCDECKRRLIEYAGETSITGCRCPICRVDIHGSEKIFFN